MESRMVLLLVAVGTSLSPSAAAGAQPRSPVDQALQLANQGNLDRAIQVLRDHLGKHATDVQSRVMWGRVLDYDGRPDEAVRVWETGLTGAEADFPLLMAIGEIRRRQGNDGPTVVYRRGMVTFNPSKNEDDEARFKRLRLEDAASAYAKARKIRPEEPTAAKELASVYSAQEKHGSAAEIWNSLVKQEPNNSEYCLGLALATRKAGRTDEASQHLKRAIELNPRLAEAHEALAEIHLEKGHPAEAAQSQRKAEFYKRLPAFCTLTYSEDNVKMLDSLDRAETVRKLLNDRSALADEFLAIVCWSHPHNALETEAFESLEARGARTTSLLRSILEDARSTCTIKSTAHILARRKAVGLLDRLVKMLPGDLRGFAMDMDIAGSLDDLGDPRAVGPLVEVLNPGDANAAREHGPLVDRAGARARAALALGAFAAPEARRALDAGTHDSQIAPYCWAALYRLTRNPKDLTSLEKAVGPAQAYTTYVLGHYLLKKVGTDEAKGLAQRWEQQRAAEEARIKQVEKKR